jgi:S1-C subfamily serine protease
VVSRAPARPSHPAKLPLPASAVSFAATDIPESSMSTTPTDFLQSLSRDLADLVAAAGERVVAVSGRERHASSGILWQSDLVVAAEEAIERDEDIEVTLPDGAKVPATLVGRDPSTDIALLRLDRGVRVAGFEPAEPARVGSIVAAVGRSGASPLAGLAIVAEAGEAWRSMRGGKIDAYVRLTASLDPRFEGGAAVDASGGLVGMIVAGPRRRVLVIPHATIARVAAELSEKGHVSRGYLGASLHPLHGRGDAGIIVVGLDESGPAKAAGVLIGDVIKSFDGEAVRSMHDLFARLGPESVGRTVALDLARAGAGVRVTVAIGERPRA